MFFLVRYIIIMFLQTLAIFFEFLVYYSIDLGETEYTQVD